MSKYIDAEKLIAEIERRKKQDVTFRERSILIDIETAIASLQQEQPEVDLKKEVKSYIKDNFTITDEVAQIPEEDRRYSMWEDDMRAFARHFYELGKNSK